MVGDVVDLLGVKFVVVITPPLPPFPVSSSLFAARISFAVRPTLSRLILFRVSPTPLWTLLPMMVLLLWWWGAELGMADDWWWLLCCWLWWLWPPPPCNGLSSYGHNSSSPYSGDPNEVGDIAIPGDMIKPAEEEVTSDELSSSMRSANPPLLDHLLFIIFNLITHLF